ncbi:MAG: hypothetical protein Ta2B_16620 [Termitinemataceae bacterium]|nr:MAG: hypothetical protein Ta2B_16620 [Termitinemataceae bacterium]
MEKLGGYFGELKYIIRDAGQDGTKEVHHMPCDSALFVANVLDHGAGSAIIMDKNDHALTASFGNTLESTEYQTKQTELLKNGKFDEAVQMDIDDLKNKGLYKKYADAVGQMLEYIAILKNANRL